MSKLLPLSDRVFRLLHEGGPTAPGVRADTSATAFAIGLGFVQTGRDSAELAHEAFVMQAPGLVHYRRVQKKRGLAKARRKLVYDWARAQKYVNENPPVGDAASVLALLTRISDDVDAHPQSFPGKAGTTDQRVLQVMVGLARKAKSTKLRASVRQVALLAQVRPGTAATSLNRLCQPGVWIWRVDTHDGDKAARYELHLSHAPGAEQPTGVIRRTEPTLAVMDDAFAAINLGPGPGRTYALLHGREGIGAPELARLTARSLSTIYAHLRRLTAHGLVQRHGDGFRRTLQTPKGLTGLVPAREIRRAQFAAQRAAYLFYLAEKQNARVADIEALRAHQGLAGDRTQLIA